MAVPVELEIFMRDNTKAGTQSVGKNVTDIERQTQLLIKALEEVRAQQQQLLNMSKASGESHIKEAATIQALTGEINKLKEQLKELKEAKRQAAESPNPKVDVDTDAVMRKTNNLKMSFAQVARELPSLAMGPQMFFLAISNNLPMLSDAIADVRKQNELLKASGQKGVPVWKQLASALFSYNTFLVAAISLSIVYGKEIGNWIKNMISGSKATELAADATERLNKAIDDGLKQTQKDISQLKVLYSAATDTARGTDERKRAVKELKEQYPDYFSKLDNEVIMTGKAADAYERLTANIIASSKARASMKFMDENNAKIIELEREIADAQTKRAEAQAELDKRIERRDKIDRLANPDLYSAAQMNVGAQLGRVDAIDLEIKKKKGQITELNQINETLTKNINIVDLLGDNTGKGTGGSSTKQDYATQLAEARLKAQQTVEKLRIQIMMDSREKRRAIAEQEYKETIADIDSTERETIATLDKSKKQGDVVTDADYKAVRDNATTQRALQQLALNKELEAIDRDYYDKAAEAMIAYNKEYGTYQEKRAAIAAEYTKKILQADTEGERMSLQKQYKKDINMLNFEEMKSDIDFSKIFGDIDIQTTESLKGLQEKLREYISTAAGELGAEDLKELNDALKNIDAELLERNPFETLKERTAQMIEAARELQQAKVDLDRVQAGEKVQSGIKTITDENGAVVRLEKTYYTAEQAVQRYNKAKEKSENTSRNFVKAEGEAKKQVDELVSSIKGIGDAVGGEGGKIISLIGDIASFAVNAVDGISKVSMTGASALSALEKSSVILSIASTAFSIFSQIGSGTDYEQMIQGYDKVSSLWDELISKKMEYISIDYGSEAQKAAEDAKRLIEAQIEIAKKKYKASMDALSWIKFFEKDSATNFLLGKFGYNNVDELMSSSPEDISKLLGDKDFVAALSQANSELLEYMQTVAQYGEQLDEIADKESSAVVGVSFSDFKDSYLDMLADLDSTNEDFAGNFEKYLQKAMLSSLMANKYNAQIQSLYDKWVDFGDDGLTKEEVEQLKLMQEQMSQQMIDERENLKDIFGWNNSSGGINQSPQSGALTTMSQDSIATFEGIGRSVQTHLISIDKVSTEIRDQQREDSKALIKIVENTSHLLPIRELLEKIDREGLTVK